MKKIYAFTLAEVMIVVGIIGVIAAMTVPTLVNNYQEKAQAVQIKKFVNDTYSAVDMLITEEGKTKFKSTSVFKDSNGLDDFMTGKFRVAKTCAANATGCFASENYYSMAGTSNESFKCSGKSYVLANSAAVCPTISGNNLNIIVDTNGVDGPNVGGRDMFSFAINENGELAFVNDSYKANTLYPANRNSVFATALSAIFPPAIAGEGMAEKGLEENKIPKDADYAAADEKLALGECIDYPKGDYCIGYLQANNWDMKVAYKGLASAVVNTEEYNKEIKIK